MIEQEDKSGSMIFGTSIVWLFIGILMEFVSDERVCINKQFNIVNRHYKFMFNNL